MKLRGWWIALLPVFIGFLASVIAQVFFSPVPLLVFKMDVGMVAFLIGFFLSLLVGMALLGAAREQREAEKWMDQVDVMNQESRRQFIRRLDHEIKNPLTGLRTALVNLREARLVDERERAAVGRRGAVV